MRALSGKRSQQNGKRETKREKYTNNVLKSHLIDYNKDIYIYTYI